MMLALNLITKLLAARRDNHLDASLNVRPMDHKDLTRTIKSQDHIADNY